MLIFLLFSDKFLRKAKVFKGVTASGSLSKISLDHIKMEIVASKRDR